MHWNCNVRFVVTRLKLFGTGTLEFPRKWKIIFPFPFKLNRIWSWWEFSFRFSDPNDISFGSKYRNGIPFNNKISKILFLPQKYLVISLVKHGEYFYVISDVKKNQQMDARRNIFGILCESNQNRILFTIFRLIWNQMEFCLVLSESENGKYNQYNTNGKYKDSHIKIQKMMLGGFRRAINWPTMMPKGAESSDA